MLEVRTDIPAPKARPAGRPANKYPFHAMTVNSSFYVALDEDSEKAVIDRLRTSVLRWKRSTDNMDTRFRVTPVDHPDTGEPAVGVWRLL